MNQIKKILPFIALGISILCMSQEYDAFIEKLKRCTPEEIIQSSYEKVFKEVRCCQLNDCPLYPYKMGKRPKVDTNSNISEKSGS